MTKHSKRLLGILLLGLAVVGLGAAEFYREIRPMVIQTHLAKIAEATSELPDLVRNIQFEGPVDYVQYHGYSARPASFLVASHLRRESLGTFCAANGFDIVPSNSHPVTQLVVGEFNLDPKTFGFHCEGAERDSIVGNSRGSPAWLVQADYCPDSGLIVMELNYLSDK